MPDSDTEMPIDFGEEVEEMEEDQVVELQTDDATASDAKIDAVAEERDETRHAANAKASAISDEDAQLIADMLLPPESVFRNPTPNNSPANLHLRREYALNLIRDATMEPYAVDFVLQPKITYALCSLVTNTKLTPAKMDLILDIFINTSASSSLLSQTLVQRYRMVDFLVKLAEKERRLKVVQLLLNLSGMCPEIVAGSLQIDYVHRFVDIFTGSTQDDVSTTYGQILVSLSSVSTVRHAILESHMEKFLPLCGPLNKNTERRMVALGVLRNLAMDTGMHSQLLDKEEYLTAVLEPIMSKDFQFSDDEMEVLPIALQYFDGEPLVDDEGEAMVIDILFKLCDSRTGREKLRESGVYPVLRELHKVQKERRAQDELGVGSEAGGIVGPNGPLLHLLDQDDPLEAVIGILIRTEEDMGLPADVNLQDVVMS